MSEDFSSLILIVINIFAFLPLCGEVIRIIINKRLLIISFDARVYSGSERALK
jgi:hypothetical protein